MKLNLKQLPKQATTACREQGPSQEKLVASGSLNTTLHGVALEPWTWPACKHSEQAGLKSGIGRAAGQALHGTWQVSSIQCQAPEDL